MANKEFVKLAVIGCGWIAKSVALLTKLVNNTKIVAGMDLSLDNAKKIAGKNNAYTDAEKMYEKEDFDAVYLATPHHLHRPMIQQAFEYGKHVLCEKPVGISIEDARIIKELSKQYSDLKLGFNYDRRYNNDCHELAMGIHDEQIGTPYFANCNVYYSRESDYFEKGPWRCDKESCGGGTLLIHASHMIDILCWTLGEPKSAIGKIDTLKFQDIEVEDVGFGTLEFENGCLAQINGSMIVKPKMRPLGPLEEIHVFGEKGRVHFSGVSPFSKIKWRGVKSYKYEKLYRGVHTLQRSVRAFSDWILRDKPYFNTIDESATALRVVMAIYKSSQSNKRESVEKL